MPPGAGYPSGQAPPPGYPGAPPTAGYPGAPPPAAGYAPPPGGYPAGGSYPQAPNPAYPAAGGYPQQSAGGFQGKRTILFDVNSLYVCSFILIHQSLVLSTLQSSVKFY